MKMKVVLFVLLTALLLALAAVSQTPAGPKHHAVFQLSEPGGEDWGALIRHVNNMRTAFEKDGGVEIEVVFYSAGLNMLRKSNKAYEQPLKQLADKGVTLAACQNAMRVMNVKTEDLFPFAKQVDSGVAELVRKQEAGWAYIH